MLNPILYGMGAAGFVAFMAFYLLLAIIGDRLYSGNSTKDRARKTAIISKAIFGFFYRDPMFLERHRWPKVARLIAAAAIIQLFGYSALLGALIVSIVAAFTVA